MILSASMRQLYRRCMNPAFFSTSFASILILSSAGFAALKPAAALLNHFGRSPVLVQPTAPAANPIRIDFQVPEPQFQTVAEQSVGGKSLQRCFLGNSLFYGA